MSCGFNNLSDYNANHINATKSITTPVLIACDATVRTLRAENLELVNTTEGGDTFITQITGCDCDTDTYTPTITNITGFGIGTNIQPLVARYTRVNTHVSVHYTFILPNTVGGGPHTFDVSLPVPYPSSIAVGTGHGTFCDVGSTFGIVSAFAYELTPTTFQVVIQSIPGDGPLSLTFTYQV